MTTAIDTKSEDVSDLLDNVASLTSGITDVERRIKDLLERLSTARTARGVSVADDAELSFFNSMELGSSPGLPPNAGTAQMREFIGAQREYLDELRGIADKLAHTLRQEEKVLEVESPQQPLPLGTNPRKGAKGATAQARMSSAAARRQNRAAAQQQKGGASMSQLQRMQTKYQMLIKVQAQRAAAEKDRAVRLARRQGRDTAFQESSAGKVGKEMATKLLQGRLAEVERLHSSHLKKLEDRKNTESEFKLAEAQRQHDVDKHAAIQGLSDRHFEEMFQKERAHQEQLDTERLRYKAALDTLQKKSQEMVAREREHNVEAARELTALKRVQADLKVSQEAELKVLRDHQAQAKQHAAKDLRIKLREAEDKAAKATAEAIEAVRRKAQEAHDGEVSRLKADFERRLSEAKVAQEQREQQHEQQLRRQMEDAKIKTEKMRAAHSKAVERMQERLASAADSADRLLKQLKQDYAAQVKRATDERNKVAADLQAERLRTADAEQRVQQAQDALRTAEREAKAKTTSLQRSIDAATAQATQARERADILERRVRDSEDAAREAEASIREVKAEVVEHRNRSADLGNQLSEANERVASLSKRHQESQVRAEKAEEAVVTIKNEIKADAQAQVQALRSKMEEAARAVQAAMQRKFDAKLYKALAKAAEKNRAILETFRRAAEEEKRAALQRAAEERDSALQRQARACLQVASSTLAKANLNTTKQIAAALKHVNDPNDDAGLNLGQQPTPLTAAATPEESDFMATVREQLDENSRRLRAPESDASQAAEGDGREEEVAGQ